MRKKELKLVPRTKKKSSIFSNKKKRYFYVILIILPILVIIGILTSNVIKQVNALNALANGEISEVDPKNVISSMNYVLRENATEYQEELFAELKNAIEGDPAADDQTIAELVGKNYVADFYTWTNKAGQYDIGGFYYIYNGEYENGDHFKENVYLKARDGFYKYLSTYAMQYGKENLIQVDSIETVSCAKSPEDFVINEHVANKQDENGEWYDYREDHAYDCYFVSLKWTYKENNVLNLNQFADSINLAVINHDGKFVIVEASENKINGRTETKEDTDIEAAADAETTSEAGD